MTCVDTGAVWLGEPGRLVTLPDPDPDVEVINSGEVAIHIGVSGGRTLDVSGNGLRTWTYQFQRMTQTESDLLDSFHNGSRGTGPFALIDPVWINRFTANQAAAGSVHRDTRGFATYPGDAVRVDAMRSYCGPTSIEWILTGEQPRVHTLMLPSGWPTAPAHTPSDTWANAHPVIPGTGVHFGAWLYASEPVWAGWVPRWLDAHGYEITADADPAPRTLSGDCWRFLTGSATAPPGTAWVAPQVVAATLTGPAYDAVSLHLDELSMVYGDTPPGGTDRLPGAGIPQAAISKWSQTVKRLGVIDGALELTEVTAPELCPDTETG